MRPPKPLSDLVDRFDPDVFDVPSNHARLRLTVSGQGEWDAVVEDGRVRIEGPSPDVRADATLSASAGTWETMAQDPRNGGVEAYRRGRLALRRNLHLAVGFLAATSGATEPGRLRFRTVRTDRVRFSILEAGVGDPIVMLHGLGGTKVSFLPTVAALVGSHRAIAVDLPGFGDSGKPLGAPYDSAFFARSVVALLDALELERPHLIGHSMGGRVALEVGLTEPERTAGLVLLTPSLAWLRDRQWARFVRFLRPELGLLQVAPRRTVESLVHRLVRGDGDSPWVDAGVDEFLRAFLTARGRAAFYASARQIYLEEPEGPEGFWTRLRALAPESMFVWGRHDDVVPIAFQRHVRERLPAARHVELNCGHVPQLERPGETNAAIADFLASLPQSVVEGR